MSESQLVFCAATAADRISPDVGAGFYHFRRLGIWAVLLVLLCKSHPCMHYRQGCDKYRFGRQKNA